MIIFDYLNYEITCYKIYIYIYIYIYEVNPFIYIRHMYMISECKVFRWSEHPIFSSVFD